MAEETEKHEKTEDPTQKRLDDAHSKGDVAKSQEVSSWFVLFGSTLAIALFAYASSEKLYVDLRGFMNNLHDIKTDPGNLLILTESFGFTILLTLALPVLVIMLMGVAGNMVQHAPVWSTEQLKPKFSKISPKKGLERMFSSQSLMNFVKGILKITIVGVIMVAIVWPERDILDRLMHSDVRVILPIVFDFILMLMAATLFIMFFVAAADYIYQKNKWFEKQKMSMKEVKDEYKQTEGDPHIKAKIRQLRVEKSRQRMMANVPNAAVVITNPTHFSVALQYDDNTPAPIVVAKGVDEIAFKIRTIAQAHDIPLVENPPLARSLYAMVEVDDQIPEAQYKAVAQVIGYVMRQKKRASWKAAS